MGEVVSQNTLNSIAIVATLLFGVFLIRKKLLDSKLWGATVTPLASIIGSGFLIVAPLLHSVFGKYLGILTPEINQKPSDIRSPGSIEAA